MSVITGTTQLLGVIGDPIRHSLSPVMHNAAIAHLGIDFVYLPLPVAVANLEVAVKGFEAINLRGFSVTIPHKQAILPFLSEVSAIAQRVGAVNTVCRTDRGWVGTNTDVAGFLAPLRDLNRDWQESGAIVLGNGGAARAVVAGCQELGCGAIWVVGRDRARLDAFQQSWEPGTVQTRQWDELDTLLPRATLLVNTTPVGMHPHVHQAPLQHEAMGRLQAGAIAYDLIYTPRPTLFLQQAAERGLMTIDGLEMLVQQGAIALELWSGQPAPVDVMRHALLTHLGSQCR